MLKNIQNKDKIVILLAHKPRCHITANIAEAQRDSSFPKLLLDAEPNLLPSEKKMVMAVVNESQRWFKSPSRVEFLEEMWRRNPGLKVNEDILNRLSRLLLEKAQFLLSRAQQSEN